MKEDYLESQLHAFRILKLKWGGILTIFFYSDITTNAQWFQQFMIKEVCDIRIHFNPIDKYTCLYIVDYNSLLNGKTNILTFF